jgi:hypothetical protein
MKRRETSSKLGREREYIHERVRTGNPSKRGRDQ